MMMIKKDEIIDYIEFLDMMGFGHDEELIIIIYYKILSF